MIRNTTLLRRSLASVGRAIRTAWLIAGATLLLILGLESAFRFARTIADFVDRRFSSIPEPPSPFEATPWAADYWIGHRKEEAVRWAPYVHVRNPTFQAPHAAVDRLGHRITPHPDSRGERVVRVFFLGGSTTFGWYQRAEHTIPAEAARRIQALLGESARVEVTNFGVPGHTFTEELLELILQLRAGTRPDIVVFYDGINDVMATAQNGAAGLPQNESRRSANFYRGRLLAAQPQLANELRVARQMLADAVHRLQLVRVGLSYRLGPAKLKSSADSLARALAETHAGNARVVEALAASFGFRPIYVWQPALLSTSKPLTPREAWLRRPSSDPYLLLVAELHRAVPTVIGPAMAPIAGARFVDATDLFRDDPGEVFVDLFGHMYERGVPTVVDAMMPSLTAALSPFLPEAERNLPE